MSHPAFYQECCGAPFVRIRPSGSTEHLHRWNCPVSPNLVIDPVIPRRAETASRAVRTEPDPVAYSDYWSDLAFEQEGGR